MKMLFQLWRGGQRCFKDEKLFILLSRCRHLCCHKVHHCLPLLVSNSSRQTSSGILISNSKQLSAIQLKFFSTSKFRYTSTGYKLKNNLKDCYSLLSISEDCSMAELKEAYISLVKIYHPDSQSSTADPKKFDQLRDAYQTIKARLEEQATLEGWYNADEDDDDDDELFSTKLKPQHRQYLDNEGLGFGTKQQRQKQYNQVRLSKAQDKVFGYKVKRLTPEGENALVTKDKRAARRNKISNSMERIVEDLIQESMSRGDFKNLSGAGKPLKYDQDSPYMDKITKKLNQILIDESTQPEWIMMHKEIRSDLYDCRYKLAAALKRLGEPPYTGENIDHWTFYTKQFHNTLEDINMKIHRFNLICPVLSKQMIPYNIAREQNKICQNPDQYLPEDFTAQPQPRHSKSAKHEAVENMTMKQVWKDFKEIFKKRN